MHIKIYQCILIYIDISIDISMYIVTSFASSCKTTLCMYVCMHDIHIYTHTHTHTYTYTHTHKHTHTHTHLFASSSQTTYPAPHIKRPTNAYKETY